MNERAAIRLLLVEDQPTILEKQRRLLEGFPELQIVGAARDGASALRLVRELSPEVVLLDLGLPDMSGIEVTRQLKASGGHVEILISVHISQGRRPVQCG